MNQPKPRQTAQGPSSAYVFEPDMGATEDTASRRSARSSGPCFVLLGTLRPPVRTRKIALRAGSG